MENGHLSLQCSGLGLCLSVFCEKNAQDMNVDGSGDAGRSGLDWTDAISIYEALMYNATCHKY